MKRIALGLGVFALLGLSACSSSDKTPVGAGDAGTKGNGGAGGGHGGTGGASGGGNADSGAGFKLSWNFVDGSILPPDSGVPDGGFTPPGLAGVKVCVDQHPEIPCVTSEADGTFVLAGLPARATLVLTCDKAGYLKATKSVQMGSTDAQVPNAPIEMFESGTTVLDAPPTGVTVDSKKGSLLFFAIGPVAGSTDPNAFGSLVGATVTLSPASGQGPYFFGPNGRQLDTSLTKTGGGDGLYFNLDPGDYTLTFTHPDYDCAAISFTGLSAWGVPSPPGGVSFTVLPGYMVDEVGVFCTTKSVIVGGDGG